MSSNRWRLSERLDAPEFFSVWPLIAVAVLAVNDAVLKATFHNVVTGKLSDFAGCFFLPLYVSALLKMLAPTLPLRARLGTGAVVTLAIFVPASVSRQAADAICAAIAILGKPLGLGPFRIAADPTDLIALPMVAAAYHYGTRSADRARLPTVSEGAETCVVPVSRSTSA
jgi:hypothetical protein